MHGANYTAGSTIFPHQIAIAASWNPKLTEKMGEITAYELRASNTAWNFAPVNLEEVIIEYKKERTKHELYDQSSI